MTEAMLEGRNGRHITEDERYNILHEIRSTRTPISTIAAKYNVSRPTIYSWMKKYPDQRSGGSERAEKHEEIESRAFREVDTVRHGEESGRRVTIKTPSGYVVDFDQSADAELISRILERLGN